VSLPNEKFAVHKHLKSISFYKGSRRKVSLPESGQNNWETAKVDTVFFLPEKT